MAADWKAGIINTHMFGILTRPLRFLFWIVALYGIAHVPIQKKFVWQHLQAGMVHGWQKAVSFMETGKEKAIKVKEKWLKRSKKRRMGRVHEQITSVEEKRLESFLDP